MRVLIAGAGSLGTVYGAYLARADHDVQLLCRGSHAAAVTARGGVRLRTLTGDFDASLRATADPAALEPVDTVVLLCKTPDTDGMLAGIRHLADGVETAVSLQNGMVGRAALQRWTAPDAVIGGVSMVGGTLTEPGVAEHTFAGPTFLGPGAADLAEALRAGGLEVVVTDQIDSVEWSKLVHASPSMAVTALTRLDFHLAFTLPELADVFLDLVLEGVGVADAVGVGVQDWPHLLPVRTLASASRAEALARVRAHGDRLVAAGMTNVRISMLQSVERGRRTEVDAIHGHLVRTAVAHDVAVPVTRTVHRLLAGLDRTLA